MGIPGNDPVDPDQGRREERARFQVPRLLKGRGIHCRRRFGCGGPGFTGQYTQDHREGEIQPVSLIQEQESKELYRLGTQIGGMLSRQAGEPMTSYLSRRKRWWKKMKQLDKTVAISESILTDLLLDNAGINRQERIMVITAMAGSVKTEDCEKALIKMHSRIHLLEKKNPSPFGKGKGKPYSGKGKKGKAHKGAQYSYLSTVEELFDTTVDDGEDYAYTADAYAADANHEDDWVYPGGDHSYADWGEEAELVAQTADASLRDVELDVLTAFLGTEGFNSEDRESVALLTEAAQAETMAFMARSKAKGKGKPTAKSAHSYRPRPSNLSVEDRRKKLQEIKNKSTCKVCGRRGHWAGDKECPGKQATSSGSASTAFVAQVVRTEEKGTQTDTWDRKVSDTSDDSDERYGYLSVANDMGRVAYMGFFDEGDFEESDEELEADSALSSAWSYVDYPEGGRHQVQLRHAQRADLHGLSSRTPRLLPLGFVREEPEPTARGLPEVGVQELRRATCWRGQTRSEGPPCRPQGLRPRRGTVSCPFRKKRC